MKNATGCFGSDVVVQSIRSHMTQLDTCPWCSSICNALMMITGVIETFAICCLYRFHWPCFSLYYIKDL